MHSTEENIAWIFPPLCSGTQLQHFMVEKNTTVRLGSPRHLQSQHSGPWGPPLRQGFSSSLNDGHMPHSGQLALNPQRKHPGIGPYWKFPFDWVPSDLEILCIYEISQPLWLGDITEQWRTQATLQKAQLWGSGAGCWRMAKTRCSAQQCLCENSNPPHTLIYGTVGKQLPEQHVPPLDY